MSKEQIEEMAKCCPYHAEGNCLADTQITECNGMCLMFGFMANLEMAGYRKQSEGCGFCGTTLYVKTVQHTMPLLAPITRADELRHELLNLTGEIYLPLEAKFCPVCGAKMRKEDEGK